MTEEVGSEGEVGGQPGASRVYLKNYGSPYQMAYITCVLLSVDIFYCLLV
jgi:hypothetical protein